MNVIAQLRAAYELERANNRPPLSGDHIPFRYEAIPDEWLTRILCARDSTLEFVRRIATAIDDLDTLDSFT